MATKAKHAKRSNRNKGSRPDRMFIGHAMQTNNRKALKNSPAGIAQRTAALFNSFTRAREPEGAADAE